MDLPRDGNHQNPPSAGPPGATEVAAPAPRGIELQLHVCPDCASDLVHPVEWAPVDSCHWRVERRCPECEWHGSGLYEQSVVDSFDEILDAAIDGMVADLRSLQRSNMENDAERFNLALDRDLILPEDF